VKLSALGVTILYLAMVSYPITVTRVVVCGQQARAPYPT
jgi:hypothetical protein